ncbi:MAG: TetR/AcrR family transcriptional regulator [Clostridiales bacterium]|nr:TetR/AcrR family transcriptional regulator [Clostridiales bacterium]
MARKVTITKEIILDAALRMLIRDGYASINVKTLAAEIGCSTQPIVWHFENMEGLRMALTRYAREYEMRKQMSEFNDPAASFEFIGRAYIKMAIEEPNLFRFLNLGEAPDEIRFDIKQIGTGKNHEALIKAMSEEFGISKKKVIDFVRNTIIYSHGVATLIATGVVTGTEEEFMKMINKAADGFLLVEGGDPKKAGMGRKKK